MAKLSWFKWYPMDWVNDTRSLSPEAKAAWIDLLCFMWNSDQRGIWQGTYQEFARATGLPWESVPAVITELGKCVSRVTKRDNEVTIENRRMVREDLAYKDHANRQKAYRERQESDKKVTDKTLDSKTLDSSRLKKTTSTSIAQPLVERTFDFESLWSKYPRKQGKEAARNSFKAQVKNPEDFEKIKKALNHFLQKKFEKVDFVPYGSTWFNKRWMDWIEGDPDGTNDGKSVLHISPPQERKGSLGIPLAELRARVDEAARQELPARFRNNAVAAPDRREEPNLESRDPKPVGTGDGKP
jgi:uncharacterized protein YdaU (DUF1376 family)